MDRLNRISWWVGLEILSRETPEERAEVMKWFLALAEVLLLLSSHHMHTHALFLSSLLLRKDYTDRAGRS